MLIRTNLILAHNTGNCYTDNPLVLQPKDTNLVVDWSEYTLTFVVKHFPFRLIADLNQVAKTGAFDRESTVHDLKNILKVVLE